MNQANFIAGRDYAQINKQNFEFKYEDINFAVETGGLTTTVNPERLPLGVENHNRTDPGGVALYPAMSKTRSLHHIVFATKRRELTITEEFKKELYAYIYGILKNKQCFLHRMNGVANHVHMLVDVHPSVALADLVKEIKQATNHWLRRNPRFPHFDCWGEGYYAVSIGVSEMERCKNYIINQERHHAGRDLLTEMEWLTTMCGLNWHKDDWA